MHDTTVLIGRDRRTPRALCLARLTESMNLQSSEKHCLRVIQLKSIEKDTKHFLLAFTCTYIAVRTFTLRCMQHTCTHTYKYTCIHTHRHKSHKETYSDKHTEARKLQVSINLIILIDFHLLPSSPHISKKVGRLCFCEA